MASQMVIVRFIYLTNILVVWLGDCKYFKNEGTGSFCVSRILCPNLDNSSRVNISDLSQAGYQLKGQRMREIVAKFVVVFLVLLQRNVVAVVVAAAEA